MSNELPFITALCPTYKRPVMLESAIACWEMQDYPKHRRQLLILDDAQQYPPRNTAPRDTWTLYTTPYRFPNLPAKFNFLASQADQRTDIFVVWEDDDIFLPHHLKRIYVGWGQFGYKFIGHEQVFSTYGLDRNGTVIREMSGGRFHSSWGYDAKTFREVGGYHVSERLSFDMEMSNRMRNHIGVREPQSVPCPPGSPPSYVYRWGNGYWNGSGAGSNFPTFYKDLEEAPLEEWDVLQARPDAEMQQILSYIQKTGWQNVPLK